MSKPIAIFFGPNLNMLGTREPEIYGADTLTDCEAFCRKKANEAGLEIDFRQSNDEGELVGWIQEARTKASGMIINAAAYTHTSVALHDALKMLDIPVVEHHFSNPHKREPFRHTSYVAPAASAVIAGCGVAGLGYAIEYLATTLKK